MKTKLLWPLLAAMSHGGVIGTPQPRLGDKQCKNCRKPTFKSDVCDLRCLCAWKEKQKLKEAGQL